MRIRGAGAAGAWRFACDSFHRIAGVVILALSAAACTTIGLTGPVSDVRGTTIAVDSIDGPPPTIVQKITRDLNAEATARQIVLVERGGQAMYRVRGYLATQADQAGTSIAWAWDIYDGEQRRVFRLRGEDKAGAGGRSWSAADEAVVRRIARASVDQLVAFLTSPRTALGPAPDPGNAPRGTSILTSLDDFRPEAAGIFRVLRPAPVPLPLDAATEAAAPAEVPLPRNRPAPEAAPTAALAYAEVVQ